MADVKGLVEAMIQTGGFTRIVNNPLAQFGTPERTYLGASLLPEKTVPENAYTETAIRYRTLLANAGTRYSPVQKKGGVLTGSFAVRLGNSDIGSEFTAADYDALIRLLEYTTGEMGVVGGGVNRPGMQAISNVTQWADATLSKPLQERVEKDRWDALLTGQYVRAGDNGYSETVKIPNPAGHRVTAAGQWSNKTVGAGGYDPYADIMAGVEFLAGKGFKVSRIVTATPVITKLALNPNILTRIGRYNISPGVTTGVAGRATLDELNSLMSADGLPPFEVYDLQYRTSTGSGYFFDRNTFFMACTTGRDELVDMGDLEPIPVYNTLGYSALGRAQGNSDPGRDVVVTPYETKPKRIEGEAWQETAPVITEPEAMFVISGIS